MAVVVVAAAAVPIRALRLSTVVFSAKIPHVILLTEKADGALVVVVVVVVVVVGASVVVVVDVAAAVPTCNVIPYGDTCLFCPVDGPFRQLAATEVKQMERSANKALHDNAETQIL